MGSVRVRKSAPAVRAAGARISPSMPAFPSRRRRGWIGWVHELRGASAGPRQTRQAFRRRVLWRSRRGRIREARLRRPVAFVHDEDVALSRADDVAAGRAEEVRRGSPSSGQDDDVGVDLLGSGEDLARGVADERQRSCLEPALRKEAPRVIECLLLTELLAWRADGGAYTGIGHDVDDREAVVGAGEIRSMCKRPARGLRAVVRNQHVSHPGRFARSDGRGIIKIG
jgi:hypothetical protein